MADTEGYQGTLVSPSRLQLQIFSSGAHMTFLAEVVCNQLEIRTNVLSKQQLPTGNLELSARLKCLSARCLGLVA